MYRGLHTVCMKFQIDKEDFLHYGPVLYQKSTVKTTICFGFSSVKSIVQMDKQQKTIIHWFRKGLRIHDNPGNEKHHVPSQFQSLI